MNLKKSDLVTVISGNEKGKSGRVLLVFPGEERIIIEKVNLVKRHMRPSSEFPQGGIREKEASVHISKVMFLCPKCGQPCRLGKKNLEEGTKVRFCKKCKEVVN
ncbi:50S ribosomal protein L24 [Candidatus Desantisbacteria bacterium CG1_02_38_46]|uniref:Large ribosomal subunit protein uL24 n=3 Tax=unclassified Candidatus Desantisiibacteriota TaxID=3106372 RepID=A0A2H9PCH6_9BACT|nr:ribosomal protein L24 [uncultured bacterium]OIN97483.1 MAG: 50S ribosomal protein L24 [Candidatus Desantisbacteria bacterium CG1_02_38_46]PIU51324.1 MAG: 50S ribosomal protein L24 [Candidatus Desantisbacteria bacterium CG07_land_8_20_14_0_80_39_15]PIZ16948.1 MAG: 50S ribosomal protein L24 [Candidatus Desantisbacteria bacterium CG_4_10_14_0_8_um_filter_39_17]